MKVKNRTDEIIVRSAASLFDDAALCSIISATPALRDITQVPAVISVLGQKVFMVMQIARH